MPEANSNMSNDANNASSENTTLHDLLDYIKNIEQDIKSIKESRIDQAGLGGVGSPVNGDAQSVNERMIRAMSELARMLGKAEEGISSQKQYSNKLTNAIMGMSKGGAQFVGSAKSLMYGDGLEYNRQVERTKLDSHKMFLRGLADWNKAAGELTTAAAALKAIKGFGTITGAALSGSGAAAKFLGGMAGGALLGGAGSILMAIGNMIMGQVKLLWDENKKALIGGNYTDARRLSAYAGFPNWDNPMLSAAGYNSYRSFARLNGTRDEGQIFNSFFSLLKQGVVGQGGEFTDPFYTGLTSLMAKNRFGIEYSPEFLGSMSRYMSGSRPYEFYGRSGSFDVLSFSSALSNMSANSLNPFTGIQVSMDDFKYILENTSKGLRGVNQNIPELLRNIGGWSKALADSKITKEELVDIYNGVNMGASLDDKLEMLAFNGRSGNLLQEAWDWTVRSGTASGRATNMQLAAQGALGKYRAMGGDSASAESKLIFMEEMKGIWKSLYNNPEFITILRGAAAGDKASIERLESSLSDDSKELQKQSELLDAIRNPLEHIRDAVFARVTSAKDVEKGRMTAMKWSAMELGMNEDQASMVAESWRNAEKRSVGNTSDDTVSKIIDGFTETFNRNMIGQNLGQIITILSQIKDSGARGS